MAEVTPDLLFGQPPLRETTTNLVFGDDGGLLSARTVYAAIQLGGVDISALVMPPTMVSAALTLGGVTLTSTTVYDNRVTRYRESKVLSAVGVAEPAYPQLNATHGKSLSSERQASEFGQVALPVSGRSIVGLDTADREQRVVDAVYEPAIGASAAGVVAHESAIRHAATADHLWQLGIRQDTFTGIANDTGIFKEAVYVALTNAARRASKHAGGQMGASLFYAGLGSLDGVWGVGTYPRPGVRPVVPVIPIGPKPTPWNADILFECPPLAIPALLFGGNNPCDPGTEPEPANTVIIPVRKVYMVINEATLRRVDGNVSLFAIGMTLSIDVDSWTWGFSASLPGSALSNLEPSASGVPVEVEALINGVPYRALIDDIGRDRSFGRNDLRITGRGRTALLDSPYAPSQVFTNASDRTAQQLMGDVLTVNNVSMGWNINWGLEDWLVPAGVFNHQGSYISALNAIAGAAGGYIQPHASAMSLSVLPRYKTAPWYWNTVTPDIELPVDVTTRESISWVEKARYNRVYVSGVGQGVLGQVRRSGTAGDILAPMVTDPLITTAVAARQRGISVLGNTGRQANVSLRLPVLPETGIVTPGKFVRYVDGGETRVGVVRSVGVDVSMPEIWQTIGVETHVN